MPKNYQRRQNPKSMKLVRSFGKKKCLPEEADNSCFDPSDGIETEAKLTSQHNSVHMPDKLFQTAVYIVYLDHIIQEIHVKFDQDDDVCSKLQYFISQLAVKANFIYIQEVIQFYANDIQQPYSAILSEYNC
ncbi:hypothetical protein UY3_03981 [Chelonia mydas]|uniref:Uncharacterized protein n=1 Tax=Chelonia mydas TaxID=8469 RepID=M7CDH3_CHEMY|nr:hypothetical protein UY3_03981 [Chelonia mydas]